MSKSKQNQENPHELVMEQARKKASYLDILKVLDELPDLPQEYVEIPFPYGVRGPRPNSWRSRRPVEDWRPQKSDSKFLDTIFDD